MPAWPRQGEVTARTDQAGTIHASDYDLLGRVTEDRVTALGSGVDGAVLRLEAAYEVRGLLQRLSSYDSATVGSGSVVNEVQGVYNTFGQLTGEYQSHAGAVNTGSTPQAQYAYADGSANQVRPTTLTYPNNRVLNYNYGATGGVGDAASRIASLLDNDGVTHLADYSYLGKEGVVEVSLSQPLLEYTLIGTAGGNDPDTGDIYRGLDRFSRVKDLLWYNYGTSSTAEELLHGYDRAGNWLYRRDPADGSGLHDELYQYDGLYRITGAGRGTLNATETALSTLTFEQCWGLDATGNWGQFRQDDNGSGVWDLIQGRTADTANEISGISTAAGTSWPTPVYDRAGNMTSVPQPGALANSYAATYDAWNRLVRLSAGGSTVAAYAYDGRNRRTLKNSYVSGVLSQVRHLYYSESWQVLEERIGSSTSAERQFVWGLRYIDDLVLRDRDTTADGTLDERLYALQDALFNITALADTTGAVQERYAYDAYGTPSVLTPSFGARTSSLFDWEVRYKGYRWDVESGLYQARRRPYHPAVGVFLSRDPLGLAAGDTNLYRFVMDRPTLFLDPTGALLFLGVFVIKPAWVVGTILVGATFAAIAYYSSPPVREAGAQLLRRICDNLPRVEFDPESKPEPKPQPKPQPKPKPDEINVPDPRPPQQRKTCKQEHPDFIECWTMSDYHVERSYPGTSILQAEPLMRPTATIACNKCYSPKPLKARRGTPSDKGPCQGKGGYHYDCDAKSRFIDTVSCCPCCEDTPTGPVLKTRCACHYAHTPRP